MGEPFCDKTRAVVLEAAKEIGVTMQEKGEDVRWTLVMTVASRSQRSFTATAAVTDAATQTHFIIADISPVYRDITISSPSLLRISNLISCPWQAP